MNLSSIKKIISKLPDSPGVYVFKHGEKILYIGKATSLRDRVRSYFNKDIINSRSPLVWKMLDEFDSIDHIKTDSVLEALVLEAHLIKKYQPEANIKEKDNRSFNFVVITKEKFPRVLTVRDRELLKDKTKDFEVAFSFGPFPNGSQLKEALKIVRKLFPYRDKCVSCEEKIFNKNKINNKKNESISCDISHDKKFSELKSKLCKPCFNRQIGLCPGVCTGEITEEEYGEGIENVKLFFEGNKKKIIKNLEKDMKTFAKLREFEKAQQIKKTIFTLNHIQDISLIKEDAKTELETFRIESYDVAHMSGFNVVGVMTVVEDGEIKKSDYRKFKITPRGTLGVKGNNDVQSLKEVLERRLAHIEWKFPDLIVVDGGKAQKNAVESVLKENGNQIPVVSVVKDERHKPKEILGDKKLLKYEREIIVSNSEAHRYAINFHKQLREKIK